MSIVNFISSWLKDIVVLFILISIAELVMPKGNMKRYIDLIIGFLIIFTIISPFAKLINKEFSFDKTVFNYSNSSNLVNRNEEEFQMEQERQIEKLYKEKIKKEIIKLIEEESTYMVYDVVVNLVSEDEVYGEIYGLKIVLKEDDKNINENRISIEKIEVVDINKEPTSEIQEEDDNYIELKNILSYKYNIEKDKISIIKY